MNNKSTHGYGMGIHFTGRLLEIFRVLMPGYKWHSSSFGVMMQWDPLLPTVELRAARMRGSFCKAKTEEKRAARSPPSLRCMPDAAKSRIWGFALNWGLPLRILVAIMGQERTEMKRDLLSAQEAMALQEPCGNPTAAQITLSKCLCNLILREKIHFVPFAALRGLSQPLFWVYLI